MIQQGEKTWKNVRNVPSDFAQWGVVFWPQEALPLFPTWINLLLFNSIPGLYLAHHLFICIQFSFQRERELASYLSGCPDLLAEWGQNWALYAENSALVTKPWDLSKPQFLV